jgi:hypothetical protein
LLLKEKKCKIALHFSFPGSGVKKCLDPDLGSGLRKWSDPGSGIKHPGSATLAPQRYSTHNVTILIGLREIIPKLRSSS